MPAPPLLARAGAASAEAAREMREHSTFGFADRAVGYAEFSRLLS